MSGRRSGDERLYYRPPAMRRCNHKQQEEECKLKSRRSSSLPANGGTGSGLDAGSVLGVRPVQSKTNLDRFLEHTTPVVTAQHLPPSSTNEWRNHSKYVHPYFNLGDLWDTFRAWSAYGAGVPLVLNGSKDAVIQYYVPYLSGIQLYIDPSISLNQRRQPGEESDVDSPRETSSDDSSDSGVDRVDDRGIWNQHNQNATGQADNSFMGSSGDEEDTSSPRGVLVFEHLERDLPFVREPLFDKLSALSSRFPELRTYKSCDLARQSWISVAWYPIYRIPVGPSLDNVDASFLTFHTLATPVGNSGTDTRSSYIASDQKVPLKLSLPSFGLAAYKFKVSDWNSSGAVDASDKFDSLLVAAGKFLRLLKVDHPDYSFFLSHNSY